MTSRTSENERNVDASVEILLSLCPRVLVCRDTGSNQRIVVEADVVHQLRFDLIPLARRNQQHCNVSHGCSHPPRLVIDRNAFSVVRFSGCQKKRRSQPHCQCKETRGQTTRKASASPDRKPIGRTRSNGHCCTPRDAV